MAQTTAPRVLALAGLSAVSGVTVGAAIYLVGVAVAETKITADWAKRPEIENWALPHLEAVGIVTPIAVGVGVGVALVVAVIVAARVRRRSARTQLV